MAGIVEHLLFTFKNKTMTKFVPVSKARGLKFNEPVFVQNEKTGFLGTGKLRKKEDQGNGLVWTFEIAVFPEYWNPDGNPVLMSDITHVAIP